MAATQRWPNVGAAVSRDLKAAGLVGAAVSRDLKAAGEQPQNETLVAITQKSEGYTAPTPLEKLGGEWHGILVR
jgi:hypothetical protein